MDPSTVPVNPTGGTPTTSSSCSKRCKNKCDCSSDKCKDSCGVTIKCDSNSRTIDCGDKSPDPVPLPLKPLTGLNERNPLEPEALP